MELIAALIVVSLLDNEVMIFRLFTIITKRIKYIASPRLYSVPPFWLVHNSDYFKAICSFIWSQGTGY